jgi:hypothetical protein
MNVLVYSMKSDYCVSLLKYIREYEGLMSVVKFHDVNKSGVPNGISRVPSMITSAGKVLIGGDIKQYLESFVATEPEGLDCSGGACAIDGDSGSSNFFDLNQYGSSLAPKMTPELEARISTDVQDAFQKLKN